MEQTSRTPSSDSDRAGQGAEVDIEVNPQGQIHGGSGEEGDYGRVEDSPNRRRHGGVGVADESGDHGQDGQADDEHELGELGNLAPVNDDIEFIDIGEDQENEHVPEVIEEGVGGEVGVRNVPLMLTRLSIPRAWRCWGERCQRCIMWAIIRARQRLRARSNRSD